MQFKSDEQRRAVFWRINKGKGGGGGGQPPRKTPRTPNTGEAPPLFDIINFGPQPFTLLPNGPGIPGLPGGSWIGTGGAVYSMPGSNWFQGSGTPANTNYGGGWNGPTPGGSAGPYQAPVFANFEPAQTIWGSLYLIANGVDPNTGDKIAPSGTPGILRDEIALEIANEVFINSNFGTNWGINKKKPKFNPAFFGNTGDLSSAWHGQAPKALKKRPWWAK